VWILVNYSYNLYVLSLTFFYVGEILWISLGFSLDIAELTNRIHEYYIQNISQYDYLEIIFEDAVDFIDYIGFKDLTDEDLEYMRT